MKRIQRLLLLAVIVLSPYYGSAQTTSILLQKLTELFPNAEITAIENLEGYSESYQLIVNEPLDHKNPQNGSFKHYMYLSHLDFSKPMVIETHGYSTGNNKSEVSELLNANQIAVEYRFYGKSRPEPLLWEYLTNDQAIADYHDIVVKLKQLYSGKWISTGISKGGETALIYKSKYPNDVDVAMPYVAPLIDSTEDPRTINHTRTIGSTECSDNITAFQRAILKNREAVLQEFQQYATTKKMSFTEVPYAEALEYAVLEFPFSF